MTRSRTRRIAPLAPVWCRGLLSFGVDVYCEGPVLDKKDGAAGKSSWEVVDVSCLRQRSAECL
jgi:hypothetical protein